jgi:HK97 gp10 family phage protein
MGGIKLTGLDKLQKALKENVTMDDVKNTVKKNGSQMQRKMQANADFKMGYQTGQTKDSIRLEVYDGGFTAAAGPTTEHSPYLEYGTRFMQAQPFVKPAHNEQKEKFKRDMQKLVR